MHSIEIIGHLSSIVFALAAVLIAVSANRIAKQGKRLEEDKQIFGWAQRVLQTNSELVALRYDKHVDAQAFDAQRRMLRSRLYCLRDEGAIFFVNNHQEQINDPVLQCLNEMAAKAKRYRFKPPEEIENDGRHTQAQEMRRDVHRFLGEVQSRVGDHWAVHRR